MRILKNNTHKKIKNNFHVTNLIQKQSQKTKQSTKMNKYIINNSILVKLQIRIIIIALI